MKKQSAGILVYRLNHGEVEVFLGHHGSPLWSSKDLGAWTIPKGTYEEGEGALEAAKREFTEETGFPVPIGKLQAIDSIEQKNNKTVRAWIIEADLDVHNASSMTFEMEWPPKSGKMQKFPELDRFGWFNLSDAALKINPNQRPFLERLAKHLGVKPPKTTEQGSLF